MAMKRNALGRGLDSLISLGEVNTGGSSAISEIEIDRIAPNPDQPRTFFDEESLDELASSIRELGIVQPLTLRLTDDGNYQIIAGERRWRAASRAGLTTVPAYIRTVSDTEMTEMALIENIQRQDLNAIEVALGFKKLIDTYHLTQEDLSRRLGKKRTSITNHLRLLRLPADIQLGLRDHKVEMGHARAILSVTDPKKQLKLYARILKEGLSVRAVEALAREIEENDEAPAKPRKQANPEHAEFARTLESYLPAKVKFTCNEQGKGSITLRFDSDEQLAQLVAAFERLKS